MVLTETPNCDTSKKAIDFDLPGIDGRNWTLEDCTGKHGSLIMFICNHCPFVKAIHELLVRDTSELLEHGVKSVAIMSNDPTDYLEDSFDNMKKGSDKYGYPFPYLSDETQATAHAYGAVCTPDFFGYNTKLELQYRGRLDATTPSKTASANAPRELFEAMCQIAETGKGPGVQIPSMGCSIKWRK